MASNDLNGTAKLAYDSFPRLAALINTADPLKHDAGLTGLAAELQIFAEGLLEAEPENLHEALRRVENDCLVRLMSSAASALSLSFADS